MSDKYFTLLTSLSLRKLIPKKLNNPFDTSTPQICEIVAKDLQEYIQEKDWVHNFGIEKNKTNPIKGKMFGILIVENENKELGFLSAFSGKLDDNNFDNIFVPSLFDVSVKDYFLDKGMRELGTIGVEIKDLALKQNTLPEIEELKRIRKNKSIALQQQIFDQYVFLNNKGELKNLCSIFEEYSDRKPAAGTGECAAPKLLHYAFKHNLKPLAIAEFWWGTTTKSGRKHLVFYPACEDKCRPILGYMLE